MNGYGSHTRMWVNAADARFWVKLGVANLARYRRWTDLPCSIDLLPHSQSGVLSRASDGFRATSIAPGA